MARIPIVLVTGAGIPALIGSIMFSLICYCMCKICKQSLEDREPPPPDPGLITLVLEAEREASASGPSQKQEGDSFKRSSDPLRNFAFLDPGIPKWFDPPQKPPRDDSWIVPPPDPPPSGPSNDTAPTAPRACPVDNGQQKISSKEP